VSSTDLPPVLCILGKKNSGKTGLTVRLARELRSRGRRVMTVKHGHTFDLDKEGTDSWRHRHEGEADRVVVASPEGFAVVGGWPEREMSLDEIVRSYLTDAEVVLAEGYKVSPHPKVEVFRSAAHRDPLIDPADPSADSLLAVVTDRPDLPASVPIFALDDPALATKLGDLVEKELLDG
jgi:molybdopterin-guanine dinucleotide biosynthesis protein B